ncbi:DUF2238 domain-containing protein [Klebsiella sp. NPDC088457]
MTLIVGGRYTSANVAIGFDVQVWLNVSRNPYHNPGHFFQQMAPAPIFLLSGWHHRALKTSGGK